MFFFFQAEDGIRDYKVTGVQTCALPIYARKVLDAALAKNPKDLDALVQRSDLLILDGKYNQAELDLNQVLRLNPGSAEVHYIFAKLHQARRADLSYRQELTEALRIQPFALGVRL